VQGEWFLVLAAGGASAALRLAPEGWIRGRAPPKLLANALPWLPVVVAGALVGVLHLGAPTSLRWQYAIAAVPAGATLLWRRSFYLPLVAGAATLAILRWLT